MGYGQEIKFSFMKFWQSPALLSILLLEFIITVLMGFLFYLVDILILKAINLEMLAMQGADWHAMLNPTTIAVGVVLLILQGLIFIYVDSFFKAGFYGMLKNTIHDGSTVFGEFMPSAKRYWYALFRFLLLRYAILFIITLPFIISFLFYLWTTPQFVTPTLNLVVLVTFLLGIMLGLLTFFLLLWGEAIIVFEDANALEAAKTSVKLVKKNVGKALLSLVTFLWVVVLAIVLSSIISLPIELLASRMPPELGFELGRMTPLWEIVNGIVDFLLNILTISATIIGSLFIFLVYYELTTGKTKVNAAYKKPLQKITKKK